MITEYRIEMWNPIANKYVMCWKGHSLEMAETMMFKPYYQIHTRRLIKTTEDILYKEKAKKK